MSSKIVLKFQKIFRGWKIKLKARKMCRENDRQMTEICRKNFFKKFAFCPLSTQGKYATILGVERG